METLQQLFSSIDWTILYDLVIRVLAVLICLSVHETCHGLAAYALGDPTAKAMQRLSLNPLHHIDWLGLMCMLVAGFGWAKPVPVNMRYFKKPRVGMAIVAIAGPISNILFGAVSLFIAYALNIYVLGSFDSVSFLFVFISYVVDFFLILANVNIGFAVFNILPVPPLDGSRVASLILPPRYYYKLMEYERYIQLAMFILIMLNVLTVPLAWGRNLIMNGLTNIILWILL